MAAIPVCRLGDVGSGHHSFPPTTVNSVSSNGFANSLGIARKNDTLIPHSSPSPSPEHNRVICGCSTKTFLNGRGMVRIGDAICCGGIMVTASSNVHKG